MKISQKILMAKARGFTISIEKMNEMDRRRNPSSEFGRDYNNLLEAAKEMYPELERIFPPAVSIKRSQTGGEYTSGHYSEIDSYCEQIFQLVSECEER